MSEALRHFLDLVLIRVTVLCMVVGVAGSFGLIHHAQDRRVQHTPVILNLTPSK